MSSCGIDDLVKLLVGTNSSSAYPNLGKQSHSDKNLWLWPVVASRDIPPPLRHLVHSLRYSTQPEGEYACKCGYRCEIKTKNEPFFGGGGGRNTFDVLLTSYIHFVVYFVHLSPMYLITSPDRYWEMTHFNKLPSAS